MSKQGPIRWKTHIQVFAAIFLGIPFLAQATNVHLTWKQEALLLPISMLTSKGAAGVMGARFTTLAVARWEK